MPYSKPRYLRLGHLSHDRNLLIANGTLPLHLIGSLTGDIEEAHFSLDKIICTKVEKLLKANYIQEVHTPT